MNDSIGHYKFGIDFTSVREIPEDPKERLPFFTAFKALLKQEKEKRNTNGSAIMHFNLDSARFILRKETNANMVTKKRNGIGVISQSHQNSHSILKRI